MSPTSSESKDTQARKELETSSKQSLTFDPEEGGDIFL
jgi:hypothetical protein